MVEQDLSILQRWNRD